LVGRCTASCGSAKCGSGRSIGGGLVGDRSRAGRGRGMETVKFPCEHCGNLMAVTMNLIGQQVRCPHCQQVVVAPASHPATTVVVPNPIASPVAEDLSFSVNKELHDHESIFAEGGDDALFGGAPTARVELPS